MKKLLITLYAIIMFANIASSQVTVTLNDLIGTKWQLLNDYESHSGDYYEFTNKALIWHCSDGDTITYPFYLTNTEQKSFDSSKVGVITKGCYCSKFIDKDIYYCYAIINFDKSSGRMVHKRVYPKDIIGLTDTFTFILMK